MTDQQPPPFPIPPTDEALLAQCRVETFRSGGPGGQHQNTTDSGVRLTHEPTGLRATARDARSQHRNRALALERLRIKLEDANRRDPPRVPTRVPRGQKQKRVDDKKRRGKTKKLRKPPDQDGE